VCDHDNYDAGKRNTGSTKTTCPAVLSNSLCVVVMIIVKQEYRKTGIQEYRKYKDDLFCSPILFSFCGGDDNYDTGIQ
jgi:hypothetical protein